MVLYASIILMHGRQNLGILILTMTIKLIIN